MDLIAKLPDLDDAGLKALRENADRLQQSGTPAQRNAAQALMPELEAEIARRREAKLEAAKAKRKVAKGPAKASKTAKAGGPREEDALPAA